MKHLIALIFISALLGCSKENQKEIVRYDGPIVGKWQLIETFISSDGIEWPQWYEIETEDSYTYTFKTNGEFLISLSGDCSSGMYIIDPTYLILNYDCDNTTTHEVIKKRYEFSSDFLILKPLSDCIEAPGCGFKFKKTEDF